MAHYDVPRARYQNLAASCEKRRGRSPVPLNLKECLSPPQIHSLRQMESFGWNLAFVRRESAEAPVVVVKNSTKRCFGLLENDGSINLKCDIDIRD